MKFNEGIKLNNGKVINLSESNKQIKKEDLPTQFAAIFDLMDSNSDGILQTKEIKNLWDKVSEFANNNNNNSFINNFWNFNRSRK